MVINNKHLRARAECCFSCCMIFLRWVFECVRPDGVKNQQEASQSKRAVLHDAARPFFQPWIFQFLHPDGWQWKSFQGKRVILHAAWPFLAESLRDIFQMVTNEKHFTARLRHFVVDDYLANGKKLPDVLYLNTGAWGNFRVRVDVLFDACTPWWQSLFRSHTRSVCLISVKCFNKEVRTDMWIRIRVSMSALNFSCWSFCLNPKPKESARCSVLRLSDHMIKHIYHHSSTGN